MKHVKYARKLLSGAALCMAMISGVTGTQAAENAFSGNGPFGGRASEVQFDPTDANRVYSRSLGNGLFFSDDGGTTWARFEVNHPSIAVGQITDIEIDPNNPSTIWVVDSGNEVARSTDRGVTWTVSTSGLPGGLHSLTADKADSGTVFARNSSELYRSTDNGDTWANVSTGLTDTPVKSIMQSPSDTDVFMALSWDGPYTSSDGGQSWVKRADTLPLTNNGYVFANYGVFDPSNSDVALINVSNEENWRTLDGGITWEPYGFSVPNDFFTEMVRDPANANRIFMGTGNNDLIVSNDNGLTWGAADVSGLGQYTVNDIAFDSASPSRMLVATSTKGILASLDSGANWTLSTEGFVSTGVNAVGFSTTEDRIYAGTSGGTATSGNDGITWESNVGTYDLQTFAIQADPLLADHAYAGSSCCGLYETFDGGQTWDRINLELPSVAATWVTSIDIPESNSQQLAFTDYNRGLFATQDGGATWAQLSGGLEPFFSGNVQLQSVDASESDTNILFVTSSNFQSGGVFRSGDFGATWTRKSGDGIAGPGRTYSVAIHPENANIVFAGTSSLLRSIDGGDTWTLPSPGVSGSVLAIEIDNDNPLLMYALSEINGLYRSVDAGNSWVAAPSDNTAARTNQMAVDPDDRGRVLVGYDNIGYQEFTYSTDLQAQDNSGDLEGTVGESFSIAIAVDSTGPITANAVELIATVPPELTIGTAAANTGTCAIDGQVITCALGALATSASAAVDLGLTPLADGEFTVSVTVLSLESDPDVSNNTVDVAVTVGDTLDTDGDGIADSLDNCTALANANQIDSDGDGYGNACDADFNNDCVVNFLDIAAFSGEFLGTNAVFDINTDGIVNFLDYVVLSQSFLQQPGPGLGTCE